MSKLVNILIDEHNGARTLTDGEREILNEQNRDSAADAQAEWDALTEEEQNAAMEAAQRDYERMEANDAYERECRRLDIAQRDRAEREVA